MIAFIDVHRGAYGVEPICRTLQIAPSTYHEHAARRRDPARRPARQRRDIGLMRDIGRIWDENVQVHGCERSGGSSPGRGIKVARCTIARLMQQMDLKRVVRRKAVRTPSATPPRRAAR